MDALSVGAVVKRCPIIRIAVVVRVVGGSLSKREEVGVCCVFRGVIAVSIAVSVLPLRGVEGPNIGALRDVPLKEGPLIRRVAGTVAVAVKATVSVPIGFAVNKGTVIAVNGIRVVITVPITV